MQQAECYGSINDALTGAVTALGGHKKVGALLRPEFPSDHAGQWLRECLNPDRRAKLSPEQTLFIIRESKRVGFHALMEYVAFDAGYRATPVDPKAQEEELQQRFIAAVDGLTAIQAQLQRVQRLRTVA